MYSQSLNEEMNMKHRRHERDARGVSPKQKAARGSYAEKRLKEL